MAPRFPLAPGLYVDDGLDGARRLIGVAADGRRVFEAGVTREFLAVLERHGSLERIEGFLLAMGGDAEPVREEPREPVSGFALGLSLLRRAD